MTTDITCKATPEEQELEKKNGELASLEADLIQHELDLLTLRAELAEFESRYLRTVGVLYAELDEIEAQIAEAHARRKPSDSKAQEQAALVKRGLDALVSQQPNVVHFPSDMSIGTCTLPDGGMYVGAFKDGQPNGQGTVTYTNGAKYVGEYKDGERNGQGAYTFPDGAKYVGEWRDGKYHGQGTYTYSDGQKYVGEYKDDKRNGQGAFMSPVGLKYVGEWRDGEYNGQGTMTFPNGDMYVGEHKDGERNGQGIKYRADGSVLSSGTWENNTLIRGR